jgi:hypothetical protein
MTESEQKPAIKRPLVAKLALIMGEIDRVAKTGWNDFHKYPFAREADIVEAVRGKLSEQKIFIFPNIESISRTPLERTTKGGVTKTFITDIMVKWTFIDGESGEQYDCLIPGCGEDSGDKGFYKAFTGSEKYLLTKAFLIPTLDDPENHDAETAGHQAEEPRPDPFDQAQGIPRQYKLNPLPQAMEPQMLPKNLPQPDSGEAHIEGAFGEVVASDDGQCWFVKVGKVSMFTYDKKLAQSIAAENGREVVAHGRMKPGGKAYRILSYVSKD